MTALPTCTHMFVTSGYGTGTAPGSFYVNAASCVLCGAIASVSAHPLHQSPGSPASHPAVEDREPASRVQIRPCTRDADLNDCAGCGRQINPPAERCGDCGGGA